MEQGPPLTVGRIGVDEELRALLRGCCSEDMRASHRCFGVAVVCHDADVGASVGLGGEGKGHVPCSSCQGSWGLPGGS